MQKLGLIIIKTKYTIKINKYYKILELIKTKMQSQLHVKITFKYINNPEYLDIILDSKITRIYIKHNIQT